MQLLEKCISSLLRTDYPNFEIIVVDNGSTSENIESLLKKHSRVRVIRLEQNMGVAFAYNLGLSISSGEFVSFVNNDMEFDPAWLKYLVHALQIDQNLAGCDSKYLNYFKRNIIDTSGGAGRFIDKYGNAVVRGGGKYDRGQFNRREEVFYGSSLFRKKLIQKVGGFDEKFFAYYDETDLCWRLHRAGYRIMYVPESRIYHMGSATTTSSNPDGKRRYKKIFVFHYYKNRLRMLIKNQFGIMLCIAISLYLFDLVGQVLVSLVTGRADEVPLMINAVIWNLFYLKDTLLYRWRFKNESVDFHKLFLPYSGVWVAIFRKIGSYIGKIFKK